MANQALEKKTKPQEAVSQQGVGPEDLKSQLSEKVLKGVKDYLLDYWEDVIDVLIEKLVKEGTDVEQAKEMIRDNAINLLEEKGAKDLSFKVSTIVNEIWDKLEVDKLVHEKTVKQKETADQEVIEAIEKWWREMDKEAFFLLDSEDRKNVLLWEIEAEADEADPAGKFIKDKAVFKKNLFKEFDTRARKEKKDSFERTKEKAEKSDEIMEGLQEYADGHLEDWLQRVDSWNELVVRGALKDYAKKLIDPNHPSLEIVADYYVDALRFEGKNLHEVLTEEKRKRAEERHINLILYPEENRESGNLEREVHEEIMEKLNDWVTGAYRRGELQGIKDLGWVIELKVDAILGEVENVEVLGDLPELREGYTMALEALADYWIKGGAEEALEEEKKEKIEKQEKERREKVESLKRDAFELRDKLEEQMREIRVTWQEARRFTRDFDKYHKEVGVSVDEETADEVMGVKSEINTHLRKISSLVESLRELTDQTKGAFGIWTDASFETEIWGLVEETVISDSIRDAEAILEYFQSDEDFKRIVKSLKERQGKNYKMKRDTEVKRPRGVIRV
jgi:hypothetical protein